MISSSLSLYANITKRDNQQNNIHQQHESFSEQIISLNKTIRTEYIRLSEQQMPPTSRSSSKPAKQTPKSLNKKLER